MKTPNVSRNLSLALSLLALVVGMVGLAYASVPLYRLFCQVTGFAGTTRRGEVASTRTVDRMMTVRFNTDIDAGLPWEFRPEERQATVRIGENRLTSFLAHNTSGHTTVGHATYNVVPEKAGIYFVKIECFCFQNQSLPAGQTVHMPVSFYLDPAIKDDPEMDDVRTITLSYTFFPATSVTQDLPRKPAP